MTQNLDRELARRAAHGQKPTTVQHMRATLAAIGYKLDDSSRCPHTARWMTGEAAGETYPAVSVDVIEADTRRSFANVESRRDANFDALQALRRSGSLFAVVRGAILEI